MLLRFAAWKVTLIVGALLLGALFCLPNFFLDSAGKSTLTWLPTGPLHLGLDLRGGASVLLEVDANELKTNEQEPFGQRAR